MCDYSHIILVYIIYVPETASWNGIRINIPEDKKSLFSFISVLLGMYVVSILERDDINNQIAKYFFCFIIYYNFFSPNTFHIIYLIVDFHTYVV